MAVDGCQLLPPNGEYQSSNVIVRTSPFSLPGGPESIQYLIMISKDLGLNHERYDVALRKLQRLEEARAAHAKQQEQEMDFRRQDEASPQPDILGPAFGEPQVAVGAISEDYSDSKENIAFEKPKKIMLAKKQKIEADDNIDWGDSSDLLLP
jgi:hypothetical protein